MRDTQGLARNGRYMLGEALAAEPNTLRAARSIRCLAVLAFLLLVLLAIPAYAPDPTPEPNTYVVQRGDTLYEIALRFDTTVEAIVAANKLTDRSLIVTGQKLIIPSPGPEPEPTTAAIEVSASPNTRVHPVREGENLLGLAFRYGTTPLELRKTNQLSRWGLLWPGQELTIPLPVAPTAHTLTFPKIVTSPEPMLPGRTMVVKIQSEGELEVEGQFLESDLVFVDEGDRQWALMGVDALAKPGEYPLTLSVIEPGSGDLITLRETVIISAAQFTTYNVPVSANQQNLLDPELARQERRKLNRVFGQNSPERLWEGLFDLPLGGETRTTAPFGQRRSYGGGPVTSYHSGHDYGADEGVPILAPITGTVVMAEPLQVRGNVVVLDHGLGVFSGFWHMSQIDVEEGQVVGRGQRVGLVGNTGLSTGPHLHWEMRVHNVPVNPLQWTRQAFP